MIYDEDYIMTIPLSVNFIYYKKATTQLKIHFVKSNINFY